MRKEPHWSQRTSLLRDSSLRRLALLPFDFATVLCNNSTCPRTPTKLFYHLTQLTTHFRSYGYLRDIQKVDPPPLSTTLLSISTAFKRPLTREIALRRIFQQPPRTCTPSTTHRTHTQTTCLTTVRQPRSQRMPVLLST